MTEEVQAAVDFVRRIRPGESPFHDPAFRALFALASGVDRRGLGALVEELLPALEAPNAYRASCIAITCGTLVELGASPMIGGRAILERMRAAAAAPPYDQGAMTMFDRAAMAHLCRSLELRVAIRDLPGLVEALEPSPLRFTKLVLGFVDQLEVLVLAPTQGQGYRVRLDAVATNAHMFTLLQGALIGEGRLTAEPADPEVIAVATCEVPHREVLTDHQRFRFDDWTGLASKTSFRDDLGAWIPVDDSPRDLRPLPDGRRVVLLGPTQLGGRSWDSNFFANIHDSLRSAAVVVAELTAAEVETELEYILRCGRFNGQ